MESRPQTSGFFSRRVLLPALVLLSASILVYIALILPWSLRQNSLPLAVGDVASQDLRATREIQYVSEVLTDAARAEAERAVAPVYVPSRSGHLACPGSRSHHHPAIHFPDPLRR